MSAWDFVTEGLGLDIADVTLIFIVLFALIMAARDVRLAVLTGALLNSLHYLVLTTMKDAWQVSELVLAHSFVAMLGWWALLALSILISYRRASQVVI